MAQPGERMPVVTLAAIQSMFVIAREAGSY
jgi:hypothetical protein